MFANTLLNKTSCFLVASRKSTVYLLLAKSKSSSREDLTKITELNESIELKKSLKRNARQKLVSKQLAHVVNSDLPGGCWRDTSYLEVSVVYLLSNIGKYMRAQCLLTKIYYTQCSIKDL